MTRILSLAALLVASPVVAAEKPNVVLIFADDLGWKDVGFHGSDFHETPHLDALAKRGVVFPHAYAGAGNCAPSRACLLSGQYTPRHGVYAVGDTDRGPKNKFRLVPVPNKSGLPKSQVTLADALKDAGYATGIFGKWHLGGKDGAPPAQQGFDAAYDSQGEGSKKGDADDPKGVFSLTEKACGFIEKNKGKPFFCYLAHHGIHTPLQARPESLKKFRAKKPGEQHKAPMYAACLYDLDESVGRLVAKLKALGLENDTLIVFTSDNGGTQQSSQEPLRGNKGCYYEGGIREPFVACWPGVIPQGTTCDVPIHNVDLFPTFLAAAGATTTTKLDGESLLPLFKGGKSLARESIYWHFPGYLDNPVTRGRDPVFRTRPVSAVRKGDWKLLLYHEEWLLDGGKDTIATNNAAELYDLKADPGERSNLAATNPAKRDELLGDLLKWLAATNAPMPTAPKPGKPNVVVVLVDDFGWADPSCYGNTAVKTPNIDRMAAEGVRFTLGYVASPICSPSRCGIITGQFPARWKITSYLQTKAGNAACEMADFLDPAATSLPRILKEAGYATAHVGKWHLGGGRDVANPPKFAAYGYDLGLGTYESPEPAPPLGLKTTPWGPQDKLEPQQVPRHDRTRWMVDQTVSFLKSNADKPCFVNLWIDDTHTPFVPSDAHLKAARADGDTDQRARYKAVLTETDRQIGRLLDGLKGTNTLVLFLGDNGASPPFERERVKPLRGQKLSLYEGGVRVPFVAWWPGTAKPGVNESTVISSLDFVPTLANVCGAKLPVGYAPDGEDMTAALRGEVGKRTKPLFWEYGRNPKSFAFPKDDRHKSPNLAVRDGDWKLLVNADGSGAELYDVAKDRGESKSVAADNPEIAKRLTETALKWRKSLP